MLRVSFALLAAALTAFTTLAPLPRHVPACTAALLAAGATWLVLWWRTPLGTAGSDGEAVTRWILLGAVALRGIVLLGEPGLSDDVYRYVWEGGLTAEGVSPYAWAPDAPEHAARRATWAGTYERMNNPDVSAAYPPAAQLAHAAVVTAAGGPAIEDGDRAVTALRLFFVACDLAVCLLLARWLRTERCDPRRLTAWAWCPLVVIEFAGSAHFDALGILLAVAAWTVLPRSRGAREGVGALLLAGGVLVKWLPLVFLPFVARKRLRRAVATLAFVALGFLPLTLLEGGFDGLFRGTGAYGLRWQSFNFVFRWIEPLVPELARDGGPTDPRLLARALVGLAFLVLAVLEWRRGGDARRAAWRVIGAFLLLTPTLHPWYLCWIVPLLVLEHRRAWAFVVAVAPLLYWPLGEWSARGVWVEPAWLWPVVALPFFALLAWDALRAREVSR